MKIKLPDTPGIKGTHDLRLFTDSGEEIEDVCRLEMDLGPQQVITAIVTIGVSHVENLEAHPLLSFETVREAAERYGYKLVRSDNRVGYSIQPYDKTTLTIK